MRKTIRLGLLLGTIVNWAIKIWYLQQASQALAPDEGDNHCVQRQI